MLAGGRGAGRDGCRRRAAAGAWHFMRPVARDRAGVRRSTRIPARAQHVGLDNHKNFSRLTARDANNRVLFRQRLDHADRRKLQEELWPQDPR